MNEVWIAYIDRENGNDVESWSVFYTTKMVSFDKNKLIEDVEDLIKRLKQKDSEKFDDLIYDIQGPFEVDRPVDINNF